MTHTNMNVARHVGQLLKSCRKAHGLVQLDMKARMQMCQPHICRMERGDAMPQLDTMVRYLAACGKDVSAKLVIKTPKFVGIVELMDARKGVPRE